MPRNPEGQEKQGGPSFVKTVSVLELTPSSLEQIVAYSSSEAKFQTLGDFIASHAPRIAKRVGIPLQTDGEPVKRVWQLTPEELQETVAQRLRSGIAKSIEIHGRNYSVEELAAQVMAQTDDGKKITSVSRSSISYLEAMIEAGKVKVRKKEARSTKYIQLPQFPF